MTNAQRPAQDVVCFSSAKWDPTVDRELTMNTRQFAWASVAALAVLVLIPGVTLAQSNIAGVVRDTSGAVLPGVTVEAASPALIEKVRTAVTDGEGAYKLRDLRAGTYTV